MGSRVKTIKDIARLSGVSSSTVSRVLNSEPGISRETSQKVLAIARKYNFTPSKRKRPMTRARVRLLVVIPDTQQLEINPFFDMGELIGAINSAFPRDKKSIETVSFGELNELKTDDIGDSDGIILAFGNITERVRAFLGEKNIPYIFLNRTVEDENYISCNNYRGALKLRYHLRERGFGRVGYLGCHSIPVNQDRLRGYLTGTLESKGVIDEKLILSIDSIDDITAEIARHFLGRECDAIMCFNDNFAIRLVTFLGDMNVKVPDDVGITGFDDSPLRKIFTPSITTISLSTFEMGFFAARWLRDNIQHRESRMLHLEVDGILIEGETTERSAP
jgi:DNA-binding LacI/PurR family transcriptional regulator